MPRDGSGAVRPSLVRSNVEQRLLNLPAEGHDERPAPDDTPRDCGDLQGEVRRGPLDRGVGRDAVGEVVDEAPGGAADEDRDELEVGLHDVALGDEAAYAGVRMTAMMYTGTTAWSQMEKKLT